MNIQIEHLAPYLPYGLRGVLCHDRVDEFQDHDWVQNKVDFRAGAIWLLIGHVEGEERSIPLGEGYMEGFLWGKGATYVNFDMGIKPILRPLSDLSKEIEHNGARFVTIDKLCRLFALNKERLTAWLSGEGVLLVEKSASDRINRKLLEWHFDIFGLINAGLAVDVNTLNKEK